MTAENQTVNSLWIGRTVSKLELLTIHSFLAKGHSFRLWVYDSIETDLPEGVDICDANTIVPALHVFSYRSANKYGHGKGSYAGFSDIFRYKLLYEYGGWWVDMDVACLKPFDFAAPYFFRDHHELNVVGNVMKAPPHSELMKACYEEAIRSVDEHNTDWHKPIEILNKFIASFELGAFIKTNVSNSDEWHRTKRFIKNSNPVPHEWYFIHWQNEVWRHKGMSKDNFYYRSALGALMQQYGLMDRPVSLMDKITNMVRYS
jgi:hypothetical protein